MLFDSKYATKYWFVLCVVILVYICSCTRKYVQSTFPICPLYQSDFEIVPKLFEYKFQSQCQTNSSIYIRIYTGENTIFEIYMHRKRGMHFLLQCILYVNMYELSTSTRYPVLCLIEKYVNMLLRQNFNQCKLVVLCWSLIDQQIGWNIPLFGQN